MSLEITDAQFLELARIAIAEEVAANRELIRAEIIDQFKWVTEATGVKLLEIEGKDPERTFRRLMNTYGVELVKLGSLVRYRWKKRPEVGGQKSEVSKGISIEELIEKHVVKATKKPKLRIAA